MYGLRLDSQLVFEMKKAIERGQGLNLSDLIRKAVKEYLSNHKERETVDVLNEAFKEKDPHG